MSGLTLTWGSCQGGQALPNTGAFSGGRALGEVKRDPIMLRRAEGRQEPPDHTAAPGDSRNVTGMPPRGDQRSVLRYPRVPRIPEVPGFPEVPGWLTEKGFA